MKVTIYTINDCSFSKLEKEYLKANNIPFEEKNLEANREYLTEMLAVSDNFAGTPVTKIEKDGSEPIIIKGFTQEEFDSALGINVQSGVQQAPIAPQVATAPVQAPTQTVPTVSPTPQEPPIVEIATDPLTEIADPTPEKDMSIQSLSEPMFDTAAPSPITPMQTPGSVNPPVQERSTEATPPPQVPVTIDQQVTETPVVTSPPQSQEALDSVLQNLQSQVAEVEGEEEDKVPLTTV